MVLDQPLEAPLLGGGVANGDDGSAGTSTSPAVRGQQSLLAAVPTGWRGPLPDLSIRRQLPARDGYAQVPSDLVFSSLPDLAVVLWAALRLAHDDQPTVAEYQGLAETLGLSALSARALQGRLTPAISALVSAGWLDRRRGANNRYTYAAVKPSGASRRFAQLRRCDLALLRARPMRDAEPVGPTQLVDFCRWQLECGQRGWTAEHLVDLARRWNLSERQFRNRRARLVACKLGLIVVTARSGHADLVWLGELHDPHWQVPTELDPSAIAPTLQQVGGQIGRPRTPATSGVSDVQTGLQTPATIGVSPRQPMVSRPRQLSVSPYKEELAGPSLDEDLSGLGGASATPLTTVTRELGEAAPQAAPSPNFTTTSSAERIGASELLAQQPYLASAPPHFRAAMLKRLERALRSGLDPRHVARALERVVTGAARDAHCELVRLALQQAWADQRSGLCPECATGSDAASHSFGCSARRCDSTGEDPEAIRAAIVASLEAVRTAPVDAPATPAQRETLAADPLKQLLGKELDKSDLDWTRTSDAELLELLTLALARAVVVVAPGDRSRNLQRVWASWRLRTPVGRRDVLDLAALRLRQLVDRPCDPSLREVQVS